MNTQRAYIIANINVYPVYHKNNGVIQDLKERKNKVCTASTDKLFHKQIVVEN